MVLRNLGAMRFGVDFIRDDLLATFTVKEGILWPSRKYKIVLVHLPDGKLVKSYGLPGQYSDMVAVCW